MAHRLDSVIEAVVLESLAPPSLELIKRAAREALREYDALERGRADELRRLDAAVTAAERAFDQSEPHQTHLRRRLAEKLEVALRDLNDRKAFFQLHPVTPPLTLSDAELSELHDLLTDLPSLWRHPLVSNEQRKAMIRAIIRRVDAAPGPETWTLAVTWAGGATSHHELLTNTGTRAQLAEAFAFIHSRFADGASAPQITQELNTDQIGQERGPWTLRRVRDVIADLQRGAVEGLSPLPVRRGISQWAVALAEAGLTPREIADRLHDEGAVNLRHRAVTVEAVRSALRRRRVMSKNSKMREEVNQLLRLWAGSASPAALATWLNEGGLSTNRGRPWTAKSVTEKLPTLGLDGGLWAMQVSPEVIQTMEQARAAGQSWRTIADELNLRGLTPPRAKVFSDRQAAQLFTRLKKRLLSAASKSTQPYVSTAAQPIVDVASEGHEPRGAGADEHSEQRERAEGSQSLERSVAPDEPA